MVHENTQFGISPDHLNEAAKRVVTYREHFVFLGRFPMLLPYEIFPCIADVSFS